MAAPPSAPAGVLQKWLGSLRDIDGILGSFVVNSEGDFVESDRLGAYQTEAVTVSDRLLRLRDALSLGSTEVSTIALRFPNHKLALRSMPGGILVVVARASVNDAALRTAMNLVTQKCPDLARLSRQTPLAPAAEPLSMRRDPAQTLISSVPVESIVPAAEPPNIPAPRDRQSAPPEGGLAPSSRKSRAVFFRGKRIG